MTYFGFLAIFLAAPIVALLFGIVGRKGARQNIGRGLWLAIGVQVLLAVVYTTPWDNYLVATGVWNYNAGQVSGVLLGFVPLEEYTFFVLEALLVGLVWRALAKRLSANGPFTAVFGARLGAVLVTLAAWICFAAMLIMGWRPGTYLALILTWALPPILIQLAFGADILWHRRKQVVTVILLLGTYLSVADALAIAAGIWTIDPNQTTGIFAGNLPMEEAVFFFMTVILLTFGMTLSLATESHDRLASMGARLRAAAPGNRAQIG
jgi:lycopene cyclase domain-containing protein